MCGAVQEAWEESHRTTCQDYLEKRKTVRRVSRKSQKAYVEEDYISTRWVVGRPPLSAQQTSLVPRCVNSINSRSSGQLVNTSLPASLVNFASKIDEHPCYSP